MAVLVVCVIRYISYLWIQDSAHTARRNEIVRQNWNATINKQYGRIIKKK